MDGPGAGILITADRWMDWMDGSESQQTDAWMAGPGLSQQIRMGTQMKKKKKRRPVSRQSRYQGGPRGGRSPYHPTPPQKRTPSPRSEVPLRPDRHNESAEPPTLRHLSAGRRKRSKKEKRGFPPSTERWGVGAQQTHYAGPARLGTAGREKMKPHLEGEREIVNKLHQ